MKDGNNNQLEDVEPLPDSLGYPGLLPLDVDKYRKYVDDFDISEERKIELLQTLWHIMSTFVQIGWGVDSVQNFIPALREFSTQNDSDEVTRIQPAQHFNNAAKEAEKEGES